MKRSLVIGSTVCDVMIYLDRLPSREGDAHLDHQLWSLGGCAFNVVNILHHLTGEYEFLSPLGQGVYGKYVQSELEKLGIKSRIQLEGNNGCCYCFIESDGERTFLSDHGVEYTFQSSWIDELVDETFSYIYVCGLEVEEPTGLELVQAVGRLQGQVIFAPGPRGLFIPQDRLLAIYDLHPILHVNEAEALSFSNESSVKEAAKSLFAQTGQLVIVTLGEKGALAYDGNWYHAPGYPAQIADTVGAGDSHVGAFLAARQSDLEIADALDFANRVSSQIVATKGVHLKKEQYSSLRQELRQIRQEKAPQ
ncbi:carbohydrate kinase family protein [Streptococcus sp. DD13]|uniref:carbohydrate kinase family protein n=1 Tax=Streptococcus sp. DD13 TaxID=1777881 RepID=UPI00079233AB|nr:PfkB family carbohydrate kinase [Streptococcus sp. DD13]KXT78969.1 Ribokinase [Streptococcus sp. DD13]